MMGLDGPVHARADGCSVADRGSDPLGISDGDALAPENTERLPLTRRATRASGSFVEEVKRRLVEATAILLGNGDEGVALGIDEFAQHRASMCQNIAEAVLSVASRRTLWAATDRSVAKGDSFPPALELCY